MRTALGLLVGLAFILMFAYQVPPLIRNEKWGELAAFAVLWLVGLVLSVLLAVGVKLPNPTLAIEFLLEPIVKILDKLLT